MIVYAFNPNTQGSEAGRSFWVPGHPAVPGSITTTERDPVSRTDKNWYHLLGSSHFFWGTRKQTLCIFTQCVPHRLLSIVSFISSFLSQPGIMLNLMFTVFELNLLSCQILYAASCGHAALLILLPYWYFRENFCKPPCLNTMPTAVLSRTASFKL